MSIYKYTVLVVGLLSVEQAVQASSLYEKIKQMPAAASSYVQKSPNIKIGAGVLGAVAVGGYCVGACLNEIKKLEEHQALCNQAAVEAIRKIEQFCKAYGQSAAYEVEQMCSINNVLLFVQAVKNNRINCELIRDVCDNAMMLNKQFVFDKTSSVPVRVNVAGVYEPVTVWTSEMQKTYDDFCVLYYDMVVLCYLSYYASLIDTLSLKQEDIPSNIVAVIHVLYEGATYPLVECATDYIMLMQKCMYNKRYAAFVDAVEKVLCILIMTPEFSQESQACKLSKQ